MSLKARIVKAVLLFLVIVIMVVGAGLLTFNFMVKKSTGIDIDQSQGQEDPSSMPKEEIDNRLNILLLGSDSKYEEHNRADTIMVASIDLKSKKVGVVSIPRDTRVKLVDRNSYNKINAAYSYGGIDLTKRTLEELLDIDIDYHFELDYKGFIDIVNTLGGVEVNIAKDLHYIDQADNLYIDLKAGPNKLSGAEALDYVRFRHDALGDIGRIQRQQKFLKAALDQILNFKTILKVPELVNDFNRNVKTDLEATKLLKLASMLANFSMDQVEMEMLPGEPKYIDGISYWLPLKEETRVLVNSLIRDKSYLNHKGLELVLLNGSGESGVAREFAELLEKQGYSIKKIGNADNFNYRNSVIITPQEHLSNLKDLAQYLKAETVIDESTEIKVIIGKEVDHIRQKQGFIS
ncbi:LCP family protein [Orenia marismortui]|uniref:LytR family transcriptional attenuator n=1 Tax=Orenia marismortui TaxID=46469 RepID=A0A4V3GY89_9FIRM|nr:LCP family protein [Orenia marismortui]TDX51092.1 LytR family transcriptional attenuator [Orenia marismortui]